MNFISKFYLGIFLMLFTAFFLSSCGGAGPSGDDESRGNTGGNTGNGGTGGNGGNEAVSPWLLKIDHGFTSPYQLIFGNMDENAQNMPDFEVMAVLQQENTQDADQSVLRTLLFDSFADLAENKDPQQDNAITSRLGSLPLIGGQVRTVRRFADLFFLDGTSIQIAQVNNNAITVSNSSAVNFELAMDLDQTGATDVLMLDVSTGVVFLWRSDSQISSDATFAVDLSTYQYAALEWNNDNLPTIARYKVVDNGIAITFYRYIEGSPNSFIKDSEIDNKSLAEITEAGETIYGIGFYYYDDDNSAEELIVYGSQYIYVYSLASLGLAAANN